MIAQTIYALCGLMSLLVTWTLIRQFKRTRSRLLLWASICFLGLALNNVILFVDYIIFPEFDLVILRNVSAFLGISALIYGFIWDTI